jgi:hypothetical protein
MENSARIRISLSTKELEIEGTEQFVKEYAEIIENLLLSFTNTNIPTNIIPDDTANNNSDAPDAKGLPATFGEYLHGFQSNITDVDRILIAGFFVQSQSADNSFNTLSANDLLKEQGIKLVNAAASVTKNKNAKRIFALTKGSFRVSQTGSTHISNLRSKK